MLQVRFEPISMRGLFLEDRFRVDHLVGKGGMSRVWAATNVVTNRSVALKFLKKPATPGSDRHRRFVEEARTTFGHRNVVHVYDVLGLDSDTPFIVMELLHGVTLREEIRDKGRLSLPAACRVLCPVISAVSCAHARGVIHCDLKPENLFLTIEEDGERIVKLLDFGLAMRVAIDSGDDPPCSQLLHPPFGTVGYAAPEQVSGGDVDYRADLWALGIVLFECLTGERPFPRDHWTEYAAACLADRADWEQRFPAEIPAEIPALIDGILSPDASARPTLLEVQQTLHSFIDKACLPIGKPPSTPPPSVRDTWMTTVADSNSTRTSEPDAPHSGVQTEMSAITGKENPGGGIPAGERRNPAGGARGAAHCLPWL
jgi:eukaryotic-like serine/threonine-protein kinase